MRVLVLLDSMDPAAVAVAERLISGMGEDTEASLEFAGDSVRSDARQFEVIVPGSASKNGRPSLQMRQWIAQLPSDNLKGIGTAAFVTRADRPLLFAGSAADWLSRSLVGKGARLLLPPAIFLLSAPGLPVRSELERASTWGYNLALQWQLRSPGTYRYRAAPNRRA